MDTLFVEVSTFGLILEEDGTVKSKDVSDTIETTLTNISAPECLYVPEAVMSCVNLEAILLLGGGLKSQVSLYKHCGYKDKLFVKAISLDHSNVFRAESK